MIKKKATDPEGANKENDNKQIENKEFSEQKLNDAAESQDESEQEGSDAGKIAAETATAETDKVIPEVKAIEEKLAEMQDRYIRLSAEFDNYRKRTLREKIELTKYGAEEILLKIIPLMDDFDRAMTHLDSATDCQAMKEGMDLIYNKFSEFLKQNGIREIESMNIDFNVDLHDAVAKIQVEEEEKKGKVVDVIQKGYYLQDKVLRHSKVVVGE